MLNPSTIEVLDCAFEIIHKTFVSGRLKNQSKLTLSQQKQDLRYNIQLKKKVVSKKNLN